ncbi:MAG: hypothetical protein JWO72_699 [Caulobacteraceae bacterium]|jgi:uncharacterized protein (UPF0276 family)|nr:hypothetical protein [Caulobacteraceae bacterium]
MTALSTMARPSSDAASALSARARPIPARAGIGLRLPHHAHVRDTAPTTAWFEAHPENYMTPGLADELAGFAERYPVSLHAVGLSLGSACGVDPDHLGRLAALERRVRPGLMSDHLSWSAAGAPGGPLHLPDLLPLPYTEEAFAVVRANVDHVQEALGRPILIENPSTYLRFAGSRLGEAEFLGALACATGCGVLLDINNIHVSVMNQGGDPGHALDAYLRVIPHAAVGEIHLAGHAVRELGGGRRVRIDDHGSRVSAEVWALYARAVRRLGPRPTLIEWDTDIPDFRVLEEEAAAAQAILDQAAAREPVHV